MSNMFKPLIALHKLIKKEKQTGKPQYLLKFKYYWAETYYKISKWFTPIWVFIDSVQSVYEWLPIIWKDRHWDHAFFLIIVKHKLDKMAAFIKEHGHHVGNEKDAAKIRQAAFLVDRIKKDDYMDKEYDKHFERYGSFFNKKDLTEEEKQEDIKAFKKLSEQAKYLKNQDYDYLFKILKKNLEKWWD